MGDSLERRGAGRPKAIPGDLIWKVISLYQQGLGYRAIARELMKEGISVDWSTVRRVIKKWLSEKDHHNSFCSNYDTILPRGLSE
jgi:transposase-like protein